MSHVIAFFQTVLSLALVLGVVVLIHEFGHYLAARLMKVRVEVFSFGFGPRLLGRKVGDTDFRLSLFPLGGYVRMAGEDEIDPNNPKPDEFLAKNRGQKIFILVMGPIMNILLALGLITAINLNKTDLDAYRQEAPVIGYVDPDSAAHKAGLLAGDRVLTFDGVTIENWDELERTIRTRANKTVKVELLRQKEKLTQDMTVGADEKGIIGDCGILYGFLPRIKGYNPEFPDPPRQLLPGDVVEEINGKGVTSFSLAQMLNEAPAGDVTLSIRREGKPMQVVVTPRDFKGRRMIGVTLDIDVPKVKNTLGHALRASVTQIGELAFFTLNAFKKMVVGQLSPQNLSGPIEIAKVSKQMIERGLYDFMFLVAFISLQLGIFNLFPIPALDGGHLLIYSLEALVRRDFSTKIKTALMNMGFVLLISVMIFVILNDVAKTLPQGWRSLVPFV
jgi:regulator of sigma E protease